MSDWRGVPGDPFAVPSREVAVELWTVADELKTYLALEAARLKDGTRASKERAGHALLRVGDALDKLVIVTDEARRRAAEEKPDGE